MPQRPRHTNQDYESLLREAEDRGWRVKKMKKHFLALCPCDCQCVVTVGSTPSDRRGIKNTRAKINRCKSRR